MTSDLHRRARRSIRLRGYDYAQAGTYFVTICTRNHASLFGEVMDGEMRVNDVGRLVQNEWLRTGTMRPNVRVVPQEFVVMPNHVHGIVWLFGVAVDDVSPGRPQVAPHTGRPERQRYAETARLATDCVTSFIAFARSSSWASNGAGAPSRRTDSSTAAEANTCCAARFPATPLSR